MTAFPTLCILQLVVLLHLLHCLVKCCFLCLLLGGSLLLGRIENAIQSVLQYMRGRGDTRVDALHYVRLNLLDRLAHSLDHADVTLFVHHLDLALESVMELYAFRSFNGR